MSERAQLSGVSLCGTIRPDGSICGLPASIVGPSGMVCPAHAPKPAAVLSREQIAQWRAEHMLAAHAREIADSHEVLREALVALHDAADKGVHRGGIYRDDPFWWGLIVKAIDGAEAALTPGSSAGGNDAQ